MSMKKRKIFVLVLNILLFTYWISQALSLLSLSVVPFGIIPKVLSMTILVFLLLGIFFKNQYYKLILSLVLILYSILFCCVALLWVGFIRPSIYQYLIISLAVLNLIVSIWMLILSNRNFKRVLSDGRG